MDFFEFRSRNETPVDEVTEKLAHAVIGAAIEVHEELGPGLPESVYRNSLSHELSLRGIPHVCECAIPIEYKGQKVGETRIDMLIDGKLVVELKSIDALAAVHRAQVITYLQVLQLQLGLLINFNVAILKDGIKRVINTHMNSS